MTTSKNTKKALLASVLSMLLCVAMLVGSTFAWFTDTASAAVNKIQAGTLDVALEMKEGNAWVNAEGKTLAWVDKDESTLWEPGSSYTIPSLRVINNGNLNLKYTIAITGINGAAKLNEAIEWTITGTDDGTLKPKEISADITITGKMKEDAGNEYQGLSIDGIAVTVYATQVEGEYASFTNDYDKNAVLPGAIIDQTFYATLKDAVTAAAATEGGAVVKLGKNIELTESLILPEGVHLDGNGYKITYTGERNASGGSVGVVIVSGGTIKNLTIDGGENGRALLTNGLKSDLAVENCEFSGTYGFNGNTGATPTYAATFTNTVFNDWTSYGTGFEKVVMNGCTFNANFRPYCDTELTNCTFGADGVLDLSEMKGKLTINGVEYTSVSTADGLSTAAGNIYLASDIEVSSAINLTSGSTLNGNGNILKSTTNDKFVNTSGGTIENITLQGNDTGRAVFIANATSDVVLNNVVIDGFVYGINTGSGNSGGKLVVTDSVINGWNSFAGITSAEFTDCTFGESAGYACLAPYVSTTLTNCNFVGEHDTLSAYLLQTNRLASGATFTLVDCYVNGVLITAENISSLFAVETDFNASLVTVQNN